MPEQIVLRGDHLAFALSCCGSFFSRFFARLHARSMHGTIFVPATAHPVRQTVVFQLSLYLVQREATRLQLCCINRRE
jgi:hypothetical protein